MRKRFLNCTFVRLEAENKADSVLVNVYLAEATYSIELASQVQLIYNAFTGSLNDLFKKYIDHQISPLHTLRPLATNSCLNFSYSLITIRVHINKYTIMYKNSTWNYLIMLASYRQVHINT